PRSVRPNRDSRTARDSAVRESPYTATRRTESLGSDEAASDRGGAGAHAAATATRRQLAHAASRRARRGRPWGSGRTVVTGWFLGSCGPTDLRTAAPTA